MKNEIPLIIPSFNQMVYLVNLVNWWNYYTNYAQVFIVDNASTYKPLVNLYDHINKIWPNIHVLTYKENNCGNNLNHLIQTKIHREYNYYCISNPDIMPCPFIPENFLDIYKHCLDNYGFHHVGFALKINDLPDYIDNKELIIKRQSHFYSDKKKFKVEYKGKGYKGHKNPIDLTFAMYKTANGGWMFPMDRGDWGNALRLFPAFHLEWYIDPNTKIRETDYYYKTAMQREQPGEKIKGVNSYRPKKYDKHNKN